ncbi:MAG: hybrid sensor histidine kinase/response regulator transcription factor [Bacteroidales bacterium]
MRILFIIATIIISFYPKIYGDTRVNFHEISLKEGLSQTTVHDICRDYKGILWIGTSFGLNRYDGNQMRQYFNISSDTTSISGNQIHFIQEDKLKNLWIGTGNSVVRYNRISDNFARPHELKNISIKSCYKLNDRIVFFSTDRMISFFYKDETYRTTFFQGRIKNIPLSIQIAQIDNQTLLLGTRWRGIFRCDLKTGQLFEEKFHTSPQITDICIDSIGNIWLSSYGEGLFAYNKDRTLIKHYTSINSDLSYDVILDLQIAKNGDLWIATDGNGVSKLDIDGHFHNLTYHPQDPNSLPVNSVLKIYLDEYNNIWIGSIRGGVIGTKVNFIKSYTHSYQNSNQGISHRTVSSFFEDKEGEIWIGTDGNGINKFDPENERFTHYPSTFRRKVASIAKYTDNELILSYFHGSLKIFNTKNGTTKDAPIKLESSDSNSGWIGTTLKNINKEDILIISEKMYLYSTSKNTIKDISKWSNDSIDGGLKFLSLRDSIIYIYSPSKIYEINLKNESISLITNLKHKLRTEATAVTQDHIGNFWIGTDNGLWKYNTSTKEYTIQSGYTFKRVSTLNFSNNSLLWIGASNKLYCYEVDKKQVWEYGSSDGVQPNIYISKATLQLKDGDLYFGGVNGFQRIMTQEFRKHFTSPVIEPIEIVLNGELLSGFSPNTEQKIIIPPTNQTIDLRLMVKDESFFNKKIIRYKLDGVDDNYIETSDLNIRFTNLNPGEYVFKAQIRDSEGNWGTDFDITTFLVTPFWWQTWWFRVLLSTSLLFCIYWIWIFHKRRHAKIIEERIIEHEKEMSDQKIRFLININHELRTPLTLISAPIERLVKNRALFNDETHKTLLSVYKQTKHIKDIIDMILDVRKMEQTEDVLHLTEFSLNQFLEEILNDFKEEFQARGVELCYIAQPKNDIQVRLDKQKIHRVISNLLMNALKFSHQNSKVSIDVQSTNERFQVYIIDEGPGLNGVDPKRLFTRFYQANHNLGGTGIGLSYSKNLIELMNGEIGCMQNDVKGATFWINLPIHYQTDLAKKKDIIREETLETKECDSLTNDNIEKEYSILKDYSVLIVEDQNELNEYLKSELSLYFKHVYTAFNGKDGLKIAIEKLPDCIISDVMMPEMNGYELCHKLKTNIDVSHIPFILLTARSDEDSTKYGYKVGAEAYLTKPFSIEALLSLTTNIFNLKHKMQERFRNSGYTLLPEEMFCNNEEEIFLKKLMTVIEEEISNPDLDVDMLAERMAVSRSTLYAKMKNISKSGVKDFINEIRIKKAMILLQDTKLQIVEISEKVGYNQQRYFSTAFKQYTQMTPTQFRLEKKSEKDQ